MAHITTGDLVSLTLRLGRAHTRTAYGVVVDWADRNQYDNACALVMIDGEQAWYDHRDIHRLNDHPVIMSSHMRDDE